MIDVGRLRAAPNPVTYALARFGARISRQGLALLLVVVAVANALGAMFAHPWPVTTTITEIADLDQVGWGRLGLFIGVIALLLLARASSRGKRHAWLLALGLLGLSVVSAWFERDALLTVLALLVILLSVLLAARCFPRGGNRRAAARGYAAVGVGILLALEAIPLHHVMHHLFARPVARLGPGPLMALGLGYQVLLALLLGYGVLEVLRPAAATHLPTSLERARARAVVRQYGHLAVHHFALPPDKRFFWSESGRSFIAFRLAHGVALALGDPIGPADELAGLLRAFIVYCRRQDWSVAIYQMSEGGRRIGLAHGLSGVRIGQEALLDATTFTLQGKAAAPVRHAVARAQRAGLTIRCWQGEAPPDAVCAAMRQVSAAWLDAQPVHTQMGFSMGRFPEDWSPDLLTVVALGPASEIAGFLTWTPLYAGNGWACDNMRRAPGAPPGTMEWLIAESVRWGREHGARWMSLGLAPLASYASTPVPEASAPDVAEPGAMPARATPLALAERGAAYLHRHGLLLGHYRSLAFFKAKFQPTWESRYLLVSDMDRLPRIMFALATALGAMPRGRRGGGSRLCRKNPTPCDGVHT